MKTEGKKVERSVNMVEIFSRSLESQDDLSLVSLKTTVQLFIYLVGEHYFKDRKYLYLCLVCGIKANEDAGEAVKLLADSLCKVKDSVLSKPLIMPIIRVGYLEDYAWLITDGRYIVNSVGV